MPSAAYIPCADPESFFVSNFDNVFLFLVDEGIQKPLKAGHHFNGVSLACQWWPNTECCE